MVDTTDERKAVAAAAQAALWVLSSGRCYFPHCAQPVIMMIRPDIYRKNVQIAHIHGVKPDSPRHRPNMPVDERDGFGNLMLMCTPHHSEIDNKTDGATRYPAELLRRWKAEHEGAYGKALEAIGPLDLDKLGDALAAAFQPPVDRLTAIADQLERAGIDQQTAIRELRSIAAMLNVTPGVDPTGARQLAYAAQVFEGLDLQKIASKLGRSADVFGGPGFLDAMRRFPEH
jgi:hypothetical protein